MSESDIRAELRVRGVVQGVGFRPFVYRTATEYGLDGSVKNLGDAGVAITLEGPKGDVEACIDELSSSPPPLADVEALDVERGDAVGLHGFDIEASESSAGASGTIPPDTAVCDDCLDDMRRSQSRFSNHWATSCVNCGPRYTLVESLPYDRSNTSMRQFSACPACREAYDDPTNRRYHAQTIACSRCGPSLSLHDGYGEELAIGADAIARTAAGIDVGDVLAIKGVGGIHLVCSATDPAAVRRLRRRTNRPQKPFAVMAPSVSAVASFAHLSQAERAALTDPRRPIVLLERDGGDHLAAVAPGLHTVGVMLPYSGIHHLLFDHISHPLVMTSANRPGRPMCTDATGLYERLGDVIDGALVHDREIVTRCDDSVVSVGDERTFVRRSRGWVPEPLPRRFDGGDDSADVLAFGAEFQSTVAVTQGDDVILSQHLGDVDGPETRDFLRHAVSHLQDVTGVSPSVAACDMHPDFVTTSEAQRWASDGREGPVRVQHHHAHAASLLGERGLDRAIVVTADGTGYGPDGSIWGGEILDATRDDFERVGGLDTFRLPGGTVAINHPTRILASLLDDERRIDDLLVARDAVDTHEWAEIVRQQMEQDVNSPYTTSAGRFLDAVSGLLDVCTEREYTGEPAKRLEAAATRGDVLDYSVPFSERDGTRVVDVHALMTRLDALFADHDAADVAATAQDALAAGLGSIAVEAAQDRGVDAIGISGGVAHNDHIASRLRAVVEDAGRTFVSHARVPPGDGGIAYGQALVATARACE